MPNQLLTKTTTPTLTWAAIAGASQYQAQASLDARFRVLEDDQTGLATASVTFAALTDGAKHFWRFRALTSSTRVADQTNATGAATGNNLRDTANNTYLAQGFTPGVGSPITRVALSLKKTGAPTGNMWVEIWTASGGAPLAIYKSASANVSVAGLTTSYATYNFDFAAPVPVVAGTLYYIVVRGDFSVNGTDYVLWETGAAASYSGGNPYKGNATPVWSSNGTADQIFTTYFYNWGAWQPVRSFWLNTAFANAVTMATFASATKGFVLLDVEDPNDAFLLPVSPGFNIRPAHVRRGQDENILGDLLTEYTSIRTVIDLFNDQASYCLYEQAAEILRFYCKAKSVFLIVVTDYVQDLHENVYKVDFMAEPEVLPLASGRNDLFTVRTMLQESALT